MRLKIALFLSVALIFIAIFAPLIFPHNPNMGDLQMQFSPPSSEYWLGTDHLGRDILSRLGYGARISFFSVLCISFLIVIGSFSVGMIAGYKGGVVDNVLMRV